MYTLQSGQLENALRGGVGTDISAKEMVQTLTNCYQPLEHRGPLANTYVPRDNSFHFPGLRPASPSPGFYFPFFNRTVNIPPWQHVPWTPLPYPDFPQWQPIPYPDWGGTLPSVRDEALVVAGPVAAGPVATSEVTAGAVNSGAISNRGDMHNGGNVVNQGNADTYGVVNNYNTVTNHQAVTNKSLTVNEGPVYNESVTYNQLVHNDIVHNHGETHHHGDTFVNNIFVEEVIRWVGPMWAGDNAGDYKGPLYGIELDLLTDVTWDGADLKKHFRTVTLVGKLADVQEAVILSGTSCGGGGE